MQSAFGVVKEFFAQSGSRVDHKIRDLFFQSADNSGALFATERSDTKMQPQRRYGTRINVEIEGDDLYNLYDNINQIYSEKPLRNGGDYFEMCFNCDQLFNLLLNDTLPMLGQDILPLEIRFFVNDIEVKKYTSDNSDKLNIPSVFKDLVSSPDGSIALAEDRVIMIYHEKGLSLISYDRDNQMLLKMKLHSIPEREKVDERSERKSALRPIDFYYRGMRILGVGQHKEMLYPCWDIKAYAFFGKAEEVVTISRNYLVADKKEEIYGKVARCADEALDLLFKYMANNECAKLVKGVPPIELTNALALSLLYHEAAHAYRKNVPFIDFDNLRKHFIDKSDFTVPVIECLYGQTTKDLPANKLFRDGVFEHWYIDPSSMPYATCQRVFADPSLQRENFNIVQNIFGKYLYKRGFKPCAGNISAFAATPKDYVPYFDLTYIYKLATGSRQALDGNADRIHKQVLENMVGAIQDNMANNADKNAEETADSTKNSYKPYFQPFRLLPVFRNFSSLYVSHLPFEIPESIQFLGKYVIVPFTDEQTISIVDGENSFIEAIRKKITGRNNNTDDVAVLRKIIARAIVYDDNERYLYNHFRRVVNFTSKEMIKKVVGLSMKQVEEKCESIYLDAVTWLVDSLNDKFFTEVMEGIS